MAEDPTAAGGQVDQALVANLRDTAEEGANIVGGKLAEMVKMALENGLNREDALLLVYVTVRALAFALEPTTHRAEAQEAATQLAGKLLAKMTVAEISRAVKKAKKPIRSVRVVLTSPPPRRSGPG